MTDFMPEPNPETRIIAERLDAKCDALRYQILWPEQRPEQRPVYASRIGHTVSSHCSCGQNIRVFRLVGWGSTLARAEARARKHA